MVGQPAQPDNVDIFTNSSTRQIFKTIKRSKLVRYVGEWLAIIHSHA